MQSLECRAADPTHCPVAPQLVSGPVLWSADEDKLLHAIVHEFGSNWSLVCDVLASSTALQGIARPARQVKERYKEIQVRHRPCHVLTAACVGATSDCTRLWHLDKPRG